MTALPLGDVLSVTTGVLVSRDHIGGVYRVCDYMTGVGNMTHQLPRVSEAVRPSIFAQHAWLADVEVPDFTDQPMPDAVFAWLDGMEAVHGATVDLAPLAEYEGPNPIEELCDMVGAEKVFVATLPDPDGAGSVGGTR